MVPLVPYIPIVASLVLGVTTIMFLNHAAEKAKTLRGMFVLYAVMLAAAALTEFSAGASFKMMWDNEALIAKETSHLLLVAKYEKVVEENAKWREYSQPGILAATEWTVGPAGLTYGPEELRKAFDVCARPGLWDYVNRACQKFRKMGWKMPIWILPAVSEPPVITLH